ncbi:GNAT family N-acetyltransferase [Bittarella massiliensis (ex Durand et al. 2017)]|uniref:GNAT family N-acetyltransferase n=1 Tax=Bittarella massiliensis (ex Durand et al. 2017) TaxID=1720313 RepID=UPI001AA1C181|nr:GNAT family N-acetyltransferase [Bittarella massiliensis (ex Durand et al. 2017)]MBO1679221.1 GNAT family N-acetyltransferase [Bittarella massiliensis (ex Durand et al. 2017)]
MKIEIKDIRKKDYKKAIQFAIKGMHFDWYLTNQFLLNAYGRYFWHLEINRATQVLAAYADGEFVGVLLAEMKGEEKTHQSFLQKIYVKLVDGIQKSFFKGGAGLYEDTTKEQLAHYLKSNTPDGEIIFLAADPDCKIKGIGTALLNVLGKKERGKTLYLYTDDACTYQFYEHRGFKRVEEKEVILEMPKGKVPLKCFVYSKVM